MCVCVCVCVRARVHTHIRMYVYVGRVGGCLRACMHIYVYIYMFVLTSGFLPVTISTLAAKTVSIIVLCVWHADIWHI